MQLKKLILFFIFIISPAVFAKYPDPVSAKNGMVVTEQHLASEVGAAILKQGGNAVDAAVAVGYALAVVNPCCGNIGGGGFMLIHLADGKNIFLNFREKAPLAATTNMFLDHDDNIIPGKSTYGYTAVGVPGTVLGLETARQRYGTMSRQKVMAPAIRLAEKGFVLSPGDVKILQMGTENFLRQPNVAAIFLKNNNPYQAGDKLIQKQLARTLQAISQKGSDVFYKGSIAETIVKESKKHGGLLSLNDFSNYKVEELIPVQCHYRGHDVISSPPPSSGGVALCEMLNILEGYPLRDFGFHSAQASHYIIEAMRYAFFDRNNELGDPDFVNNPTDRLLTKEYAEHIRKKIQANQAGSLSVPAVQESEQTTHYSIVDRWGNAVAVTYTINRFFGSYMIAGDTGFLLNDEMDDFTSKPGKPNQFGLVQGEANKIEPGKRPLSSMTPTIIMQDKQPFLILGSPGGPRIISSVLLTVLNNLDYGFDIQASVDAPRFHYQGLPDWVDIEEPFVFSADTLTKLKKMGHHFRKHATWGAVEAIYIDPNNKILYGGSDNRKSAGATVGY